MRTQKAKLDSRHQADAAYKQNTQNLDPGNLEDLLNTPDGPPIEMHSRASDRSQVLPELDPETMMRTDEYIKGKLLDLEKAVATEVDPEEFEALTPPDLTPDKPLPKKKRKMKIPPPCSICGFQAKSGAGLAKHTRARHA